MDKIALKTFTSNSKKTELFKNFITISSVNSLLITQARMQMNLKSTTTNRLNIRIKHSLMES